jgi:hypothetical protein
MSSNISFTIRTRLIEIIKHRTDEARRFKSLEEMTKISGATWRTFWNRSGAPSGEMVEAIATQWPQYAFWLSTGGTDPTAGHVAPPGAVDLLDDQNNEIPEANEYFQYQMELLTERRPTSFDKGGVKEELGKSLELLDDAWQEKIAQRMPAGVGIYTEAPVRTKDMSLSEVVKLPRREFTKEYLAAREALLDEVRQEKRNKLQALKLLKEPTKGKI